MKNVLLFIPKVIFTIFVIFIIIFCFFIAWLECLIGLIIFIIFYKSLRNSGFSGIFHSIFFRYSGLYQAVSLLHHIWE